MSPLTISSEKSSKRNFDVLEYLNEIFEILKLWNGLIQEKFSVPKKLKKAD